MAAKPELMSRYRDGVVKLRECVMDNKMANWAAADELCKQLGVSRADITSEISEPARLVELALVVPALYKKGLALADLDKSDAQIAELLSSLESLYTKTFPQLIKRWFEKDESAASMSAEMLEVELELPYVDAVSSSQKSSEWCDAVKSLRRILASLVSTAQTIIYRCVALETKSVSDLGPLFELILAQTEVVDDGSVAVSSTDDGESSASEADEDDVEEQASATKVPSEDDEMLDVSDFAGLVEALATSPEEEALISAKRDNLQKLRKLDIQSAEELNALYSRKTRVVKTITRVLDNLNADQIASGSFAENLTLFQTLAGPCYGLYDQLAEHMSKEDLRSINWVKRVKALLTILNRLCSLIVAEIGRKQAERRAVDRSAKKKKSGDEDLDVIRIAVLSYAMCYQNAQHFYDARAKVASDEGWLQLATTLSWTATLCDSLWSSNIRVAEATKYMDPTDDEEAAAMADIWTTTLVEAVKLHPPSVRCKSCTGKRGLEAMRCLNAAKHFEALLTALVVSGHDEKRKTPFRLFKAVKVSGNKLPAIAFVQALAKVAKTKKLSRELLGLLLNADA